MNSKRNKTLIIVSIAFVIIAAIAFIIGGIIAGWDFKAWFTSQQAYAIYIIVGLYVIIVIYIITSDIIRKL